MATYKNTYLNHMEFTDVDDAVSAPQDTYLKYVEIVEVIDQDGNPWEPVPGPDPWDELVVATDTYWSNLNDYSVGEEVFAHPATFIGGNPDNTTYRYRWQYKTQTPGSSWINQSWANYNNGVVEVRFELPADAAGGQVRLMAQARDTTDPDNIVQVNSFASAEDVNTLDLEGVGSTLEGLPYVGKQIYCPQPVITGGRLPYAYQYFWIDRDPSQGTSAYMSQTTTLVNYDLGKMVRCQVTVTDADGQKVYADSNEIGPVQPAIQMNPVATWLNGEEVNYNEAHEVPPGTHVLSVVPHQTPSDVQFYWTLRSGDGTLEQDMILPDVARYTTGANDGAPSIGCTIQSDIAEEDTAASFQLFVI